MIIYMLFFVTILVFKLVISNLYHIVNKKDILKYGIPKFKNCKSYIPKVIYKSGPKKKT